MALADVIALRNHRPTILCWIDSRRVYGVKARINFSMRAKVATCTLTLKDRPSWLQFRQKVEVYLGYNGLTRKRFTGFLEDDGRRVWPYSKTITAAAYMRWAERKSPVEVTYSSQTAQTIVANLLTLAGVPFQSIGGDNTTLGTLQDIVLAKRQDYWSLIDQIDEPWLCRTFDWLPDGTVRRMQVSELPAAAAAAWAVYTYPGNVLELDNPMTIREIKNRVEVFGLEGVEAYRRADSPYVDPDHDEIYEVSIDLIETAGVADAVALIQMPTRNRLVRQVSFRAAGNSLLNPGDTITLTATKVGINAENLWLEELDEECSERGYFGQYTLTGGAGEAGYPVYPPIASFTIKVTREAFDAGAGVTVYYTIFCDGSASSSPSGYALTYAWSNDVTADVSTATTYSFRLTEAEYNGGCSVTLTVTDTESEDDTLTLSVSDAVGDEGPMIRTLYLARETEAEVTPDSGENWTTDTAVDAISTPEIAGEGHSYFGMATGALYHTDDALATKTLAHTFADDVNAIWIHEVDANRVMVGCADGKVLTTLDASLLAGATWTEEYDFASPVNFVVWAYDNVRWVCVGNQILANYAVQWVHTAGYTARKLALSFVAHYSAADDGAGHVEVKRQDGVTLTFAGGVPTTVGGLQHHILDDILYFVDGATGGFYRKAAGSTVLTKLATIGGGVTYHLLRDGTNAQVLWASCASGLYKTYDGGLNWYLMRAGKTLMAGYGSSPWPAFTPTTIVSETTALNPLIKCFQLGSEPAGWKDVGFDDSGWAAALEREGGQHPFDPSVYRIWYTQVPTAGDAALFRHKFALPAGVVAAATLYYNVDDVVVGFWINGVSVVANNVPTYDIPITISPTLLLPGADNIIAIYVQNNAPAWAHIAYMLVMT